jgi:hypothetical protein
VSKLVGTALRRYRTLNSPAGVVACEIERGRLSMLRRGKARSAGSVLRNRLDDPRQRHLLQLDPWVPRVLDTFAHEIEDGDLIDRARRLLVAGRRQVADHASEWGELVGDEVRQLSQRVVGLEDTDFSGDEMAGESRRVRPAMALPQAA